MARGLSRLRQLGVAARQLVREKLRTWLITGLLVAGPISLTFYLAFLVIDFVDRNVTALFPDKYNPNHYLPFHLPGIGLVVALIGLTLIGALAAGYFGRLFLRLSERVLNRMPLIRRLYPTVKQIFETVLAAHSKTFREVVLVEFPRREMWTVAFVTGRAEGEIESFAREEMLCVLIPTTPIPGSGYLAFVPRRDVVPLKMSVEDALKLVISGGIVTPPERAAASTLPSGRSAEPSKAPTA